MPDSGRSQQIVERLLRAERAADARLAEADERARQLLEAATEQAARRREEASDRAGREHAGSLERAAADAEVVAARRLAEVEARWEALRRASRPAIAEAAEAVVDWVTAGEPADERGP